MKALTAKAFAAIVFTTVLLTGCGQKGDLYQPVTHSVQPLNSP